jgi:exopolysaccharide biosynthesis polyprenyl glycosylphosphotransferase
MKATLRSTFALLAADLGALGLIFNTVAALRLPAYPAAGLLVGELFVPALFVLVVFALIDGYHPRADHLSLDYTTQHLVAVVAAALATLLVTFVVIPGGYPLQQSRLVIALAFLALAPATLLPRRILALRRAAVQQGRAVVFVGEAEQAGHFAAECARMGFDRPHLAAAPDSASAGPGRPCLADVVERIESGELAAESIILRESSRNLPPGLPDRLVALHFSGVATYTLELFHEQVWRKTPLYRLNPVWLFQGGFDLSREPVFAHLKRASDLLLAFFVLLLAAPFLLIAALAIRLEGGGPVFFRQTRIGLNRRPFTLHKLRTMRATPLGARYTAKGDARITRVGAFLRASRLDELPQLWNVLRGEMSMIGPRAEWDALTRDYEVAIPCYHFRHLVRPGITGWAQVNYPYGADLEDTRRKLEYDLYYIRHYSFRLDAAIVLKTIHVMLFAKGGR